MRSLTLIEPVLPTLLCDSDADRRLHARFAQVARDVSEDIWNGSVLEAIDQFMAFWNGSGPQDPLPESARLRMIERAHKLAFDFTAAFAEETSQTRRPRSASRRCCFGGLSPYVTQRIVQRLGEIIDCAEIRHLPAAGHMLPLTHPSSVNSAIAGHIARADELAAFRWRSKRSWWRPSGRRGDVLALGVPAGVLVRVRDRNRKRNADDDPRARFFAQADHPDRSGDVLPAFPLVTRPFAADEEVPTKGAAVTVFKAAKACFANIVEVSGTIIPREERQAPPERMGLKVSEVMVDAGDSVTAGQVLARLTLPEGGQIAVQAPVAGVISATTASVGATASGKGEALFSISPAVSSISSAWCRRATSRN